MSRHETDISDGNLGNTLGDTRGGTGTGAGAGTAYATAGGVSSPRPFYWKLDAALFHRLRDMNLILEDEGYLAHDINRGRRVVDTSDAYVPLPEVDSDWRPPEDFHGFSDVIAAVLQVAVDEGHDAVLVCEAALLTQRSVRAASASAVRHAAFDPHVSGDSPDDN